MCDLKATLSQADMDALIQWQRIVHEGIAMGFGTLDADVEMRYTFHTPSGPVDMVVRQPMQFDVRNGRLMNCHITKLPRYNFQEQKKPPSATTK